MAATARPNMPLGAPGSSFGRLPRPDYNRGVARWFARRQNFPALELQPPLATFHCLFNGTLRPQDEAA